MTKRFFVTGTGTGVGKTFASAVLARALQADYWKPVQAGFAEGTDSEWVRQMAGGVRIHPEAYRLALPVSPHLAARAEHLLVDLQHIARRMPTAERLVVEGAGGLMVPLSDDVFVADLIRLLGLKVILVSRNELGSINHSLLTAAACRQQGLDVAGWIFNGSYMHYEEEIVRWTGLPRIASLPQCDHVDPTVIAHLADTLRQQLEAHG